MSLIKDNYRICITYFEVLSDFLFDQVVVRHEDDISHWSSVLVGKEWTDLLPLRNVMQLFNIMGRPAHDVVSFVSIFEVDAWVHSSLRRSASCVESEASSHINRLIHTEMVPRSNYDCSWLKHRILQFFLNLCKLWVSPAAVDDFWHLLVWNLITTRGLEHLLSFVL